MEGLQDLGYIESDFYFKQKNETKFMIITESLFVVALK
jgi:hypothetical protein